MAFQFRDLFAKEENMPPIGSGRHPSHADAQSAPGSENPVYPAHAGPNSNGFQPVSTLPSKAYIFHPGTLMELIPDYLLSTAAPPNAPITLQLPVSAEDPSQQLLKTSLSRIYKACPHLFAQPISDVNDAAISLPLPIRGATTVAGRLQPTISPPPPGSSPFSVVEKPAHSNNGNGAANSSPFQVAPSNGNGNGNGNGHAGSLGDLGGQPPAAGFDPFEVREQSNPAPAPRVDFVPQPPSPFKPIVEDRAVTAVAQAAPANKKTANISVVTPFQVIETLDRPVPPPPAARPPVPADNSGSVLIFGVPQLLRGAQPHLLGISLESLPPAGQARIPLESIKSQLATGRVSLTIRELTNYVDDLSQETLLHANPNAEISIPLKDIFHQLPSDADSAPEAEAFVPSPPVRARVAEDSPPAAIVTPFSDAAREEARQIVEISPPPQRPQPERPIAKPAGAFAESAAANVGGDEKNPFRVEEPKQQETIQAGNGNGNGYEPSKRAPVEPEPQAPAPAPDSTDDNPFAVARARSARAQRVNPTPAPPIAEPPAAGGDDLNPFLPSPDYSPRKKEAPQLDSLDEIPARPARVSRPPAVAAPTPAPAPIPAPVAASNSISARTPRPSPAPTPPASAAALGGLGFDGPMRDIELRAIFGGSQAFSFQTVLDRVCQWKDIQGAVVVRGGAIAAKRAGDPENEQLAAQAPAIYNKVRNLATDLGFSSSEAFTLQTGRGVISFFAEGDTCLSVLHHDNEFEPGTREKLLLVARGVAQLEA